MRSYRRLAMRVALLMAGAFAAWWVFFTDHFPQEGIYPAGNIVEDKEALGGYGKSGNFPKALTGETWGAPSDVSLIVFPEESITYSSRRGLAVRLINRTDAAVEFAACDSRLFLVQEALDREGNWRPIEQAPDSGCGNSFHRVFLDKGQYWEFPALRYSGTVRTKLRFRLEQGEFRRSELDLRENDKRELVWASRGGRVIYSNEFDGWINTSLFVRDPNE